VTTASTRPRTAGSSRIAPAQDVPALLRPLASYHLLLAATLLLLAVGLVMVFSASMIKAYADTGATYAIALKQGIYILMGLPLMYAASRMPIRVWRLAGYPLLLVAIFLLVLVLGIGKSVDGAVRWIVLPGGFQIQPSELAKFALALWGADLLVRKKKLLGDWRHLFVPLVPVALLVLALIMLEPDMGTTLATTTVVVALLWVVGTPLRYFGVMMVVLVGLASVLAVAEPYRLARLVSFLDPCSPEHRLEGGFQACQGLLAMGSGGIFGVGLGASREKWAGGLPNAHTDFVFAIIGEELGLLGSLTVLMLFAVLVYGGVRVAKRTTDPFARLAAAGVTAWLGTQAAINIGAVIGIFPITGIPLPLVSYGGSALLLTLTAIGMLLSFARAEPGAAEALQAQRGGLRRLLQRGPARVPAGATSRPGPRR
jgi:cell division protein FtsW